MPSTARSSPPARRSSSKWSAPPWPARPGKAACRRRPVREDHDGRDHAGRPGHGGAAGVHAARRAKAASPFPPRLLSPGDNRRLKGEDLLAGRPALQKGERLTPAACGLAASLGIKTLPVTRKLRVAYFSTGDEILSLGEAPREGAVYDSNRYTVHGLLTRLGCEVIDMGVVRDDPALLEAAFTRAARKRRRDHHQRRRQRRRGRLHQGDDGQAGRRGVLAHRHAPGPPDGRGPHLGHSTLGRRRQRLSCSACPATRWR